MPKIKNISSEVATFTGHPPFAPGESREVTKEQADHLLQSHLMGVEQEGTQGSEKKNKTIKGIEE